MNKKYPYLYESSSEPTLRNSRLGHSLASQPRPPFANLSSPLLSRKVASIFSFASRLCYFTEHRCRQQPPGLFSCCSEDRRCWATAEASLSTETKPFEKPNPGRGRRSGPVLTSGSRHDQANLVPAVSIRCGY